MSRTIAMLAFVLCALVPVVGASSFPIATVEEVLGWQSDAADTLILIDVRSRPRYEFKHIQGAIHVPAFAIGDTPLPRGVRIVLYDDGLGSDECERAAATLIQRGFADVRVLSGGLTEWDAVQQPVVAPTGEIGRPFSEPISCADLQTLIQQGRAMTIFDVRSPAAYGQGHLPSSRGLSTPAELQARAAGLKPDEVIVLYDDGSGIAEKQAEALRRQGFRAVRYLYGGMPAWQQSGQKIEK